TPRDVTDPSRPASPAPVVHRSPKTVKHIVGTLRRILDVAVRDGALTSNPVLPGPRRTTKRRTATGTQPFAHHPLTANQVAAVHEWIAREKGNAVYALAVLFAAHTGVRAAELQGLQVGDVSLSDIPGTVGSIRIVRTMKRARPEGSEATAPLEWVEGTPKSDASTDRVVPLAPWLTDELRDHLTKVHPFAGKLRDTNGKRHHIPHAPLFPGRRSRSAFDWAKPVVADNLYDNYLQPACAALGLGSVRFHDLRHTFATMNLSAGEHYMQVSKWLGHSSFVLTLSTYADYITEDELVAPKVGRGTAGASTKIVPLKRRSAG
ncbi:tyrosine-type recombinase/integrase, partial [Mycobacterium avium]